MKMWALICLALLLWTPATWVQKWLRGNQGHCSGCRAGCQGVTEQPWKDRQKRQGGMLESGGSLCGPASTLERQHRDSWRHGTDALVGNTWLLRHSLAFPEYARTRRIGFPQPCLACAPRRATQMPQAAVAQQ